MWACRSSLLGWMSVLVNSAYYYSLFLSNLLPAGLLQQLSEKMTSCRYFLAYRVVIFKRTHTIGRNT